MQNTGSATLSSISSRIFRMVTDWTDICKRSMAAFGPMPMDCACIMLRIFFQSGRDQFSLPYVLYMFGGTLAAWRWGWPAGNSVAREPLLVRLSSQFERFVDYLHEQLRWTSAMTEPVGYEEFVSARLEAAETRDIWVRRFLHLTDEMGRLAKLGATIDSEEVYTRYRQWLPFAQRAAQATLAVSLDLDYQPMLRT